MGKIGIIIQREFYERVKKRSFIITTIITPIMLLAVMVVPALMMQLKSEKDKKILVIDNSAQIGQYLQNEDKMIFTPETRSYDQVKAEKPEVFGILVIGEDVMTNPKNIQLYTYEPSTMDLESTVSRQIRNVIETEKLKTYNIENLPQIMADVKTNVTLSAYRIDDTGVETESSSTLSMVLAYILGFMIYMFVFLYGGMVMQGVIDEKSSKVLEIIVSSVKPYELMMGKILGIASVALTQIFIWVVFLVIAGGAITHFFAGDMVNAAASMQPGMGMPAGMEGMDPEALAAIKMVTDVGFILKMMGAFIVFFIGGYLLYSAMFAAVGSAVDNAADAQQLQLPITIPIILSIFIMMSVMKDPNSSLAVWTSIIPFTSPIIMMARIPYGVPAWEIITSIVVLYASFIFMVWFAGKIYRVGIFMYGKKPTLKELIKWSNYKY